MDISAFIEKLVAEPINIVAQMIGIIAVIFTFISYQAKTQRKLIIIQTVATCAFVVQYLLLGAYPAAILNTVGVVRSYIYCNRDKKIFSHKCIPYILAAILAALGALSWQGPSTLLIMIALMINTVVMSMDDAQLLRKSILLTSSMILVYDIIVMSIGGCLNESVAIVSSIIGIIRYRKRGSTDSGEASYVGE